MAPDPPTPTYADKSRPANWHPLAESDPVPGHPSQIAYLAKHYKETAELIRGQVSTLKNLCTDDYWDSDAGRAFRDDARDTAGKLDKAWNRYEKVGDALADYAGKLNTAQEVADGLLAKARQEGDTSDGVAMSMNHLAPDDPSYARLKQQKDDADARIAGLRGQLCNATGPRDAAAREAAHRIREAIDDGVKDSTWDKFKGWVKDHAELISKIADIASWIATIAGVLSLVVGWIPIIGQALAGILGTIALIATAVALAAHLLLAITGNGSWLDVALDVFALATFGMGRAFAGTAKVAFKGARAASRGPLARSIAGELRATGRVARNQVHTAANIRANGLARMNGSQARNALRGAPDSLPGWGKLARESVNVKGIWGDVVDSFTAWGRTPVPAGYAPGIGDAAVGLEKGLLGGVPEGIKALPDVAKYVTVGNHAMTGWGISTGLGTGVDLMDKGLTIFDDTAPGQAWAAAKKATTWTIGGPP